MEIMFIVFLVVSGLLGILLAFDTVSNRKQAAYFAMYKEEAIAAREILLELTQTVNTNADIQRNALQETSLMSMELAAVQATQEAHSNALMIYGPGLADLKTRLEKLKSE